MNVLFSALHFGYFRNFEAVIAGMAERGHHVHLLAEEPERFGGQGLVERLASAHRTVTWGWAPARNRDRWLDSARKVRHGLEYVRFLDPGYDRFRKVRQAAESRAPRGLIAALRGRPAGSRLGRNLAGALLRHIEHAMPTSEIVEGVLRERSPDLLLLASLTYSRSQQVDYLKAARALGIRTAACVMGFDHLSSKAPIHIVPDRIFVWNDIQRQEAVELHGIAADRVSVTGAQCYDQWFDRQPSRDRAELCRSMGLASERPYILYLCSAMSPNPNEAQFVMDWIGRLRRSEHPTLREAGVLIRPHPERMKEWAEVDVSMFPNVVLRGRNPVDAEAKADYFDGLFHASAVVGLVTSAFLEAGVAGRPVHTLLLPQFRAHQEQMRHFLYLLETEGGLLQAGHSFEEHFLQLSASLADPGRYRAQTERFLAAFIRPRGLSTPATSVFIDEAEALGRMPAPQPIARSWSSRLIGRGVRRLAIAGAASRWLMDPDEYGAALTAAANIERRTLERAAKDEHKRRRVALKRRRQIVVGLKTAAKRAIGLRVDDSSAVGRGTRQG
jgi:hypothetical protein